jgi:hypothetical protein
VKEPPRGNPSLDEETQRDTAKIKKRKDTYVAEATTDEALETAAEVTVPEQRIHQGQPSRKAHTPVFLSHSLEALDEVPVPEVMTVPVAETLDTTSEVTTVTLV